MRDASVLTDLHSRSFQDYKVPFSYSLKKRETEFKDKNIFPPLRLQSIDYLFRSPELLEQQPQCKGHRVQ